MCCALFFFFLHSLLILPARVHTVEVTYRVVVHLLQQQQLSQPAVNLQLDTGWITL